MFTVRLDQVNINWSNEPVQSSKCACMKPTYKLALRDNQTHRSTANPDFPSVIPSLMSMFDGVRTDTTLNSSTCLFIFHIIINRGQRIVAWIIYLSYFIRKTIRKMADCCVIFYHDVDGICWPQPIRSLKLGHVTGQGSMSTTWMGLVHDGKNRFHKKCKKLIILLCIW